jgi:hypothetical protein
MVDRLRKAVPERWKDITKLVRKPPPRGVGDRPRRPRNLRRGGRRAGRARELGTLCRGERVRAADVAQPVLPIEAAQ